MMNLLNVFETGTGYLPDKPIAFTSIPWSSHPTFDGVALKHLITSKDTNGAFSFHLVRIDPHKEIGLHIHEIQFETHEILNGTGTCITSKNTLTYTPGVISLLPSNLPHRVIAGKEGLFLFAKFIPALC